MYVTEQKAMNLYKQMFMSKVNSCGVFVSKSLPFFEFLIRRYFIKDVIFEIKCPYSACDKKITPVTVPYLKPVENGIILDPTHNYHYQVQGQLFCTGAKFCDFVVFTLVDFKCIRIERDDDFISRTLEKLDRFHNKYFKDAVLKRYFYRET